MDNLPENPSKAEVENEKVFYMVMLDTLDPDSFEYQQQKSNYQSKLDELDSYLARTFTSSRPRTPSEPQAPNNAMNLPSRGRQTPNWADSGNGFAPDPTIPRKHARTNSLIATSAPQRGYKRSRRGSDSYSSDSASESASRASTAGGDNHGVNLASGQDSFRAKMMAQARERELRFAREREDRTFAELLASHDFEQPTQPASAPSYNRGSPATAFGAYQYTSQFPQPVSQPDHQQRNPYIQQSFEQGSQMNSPFDPMQPYQPQSRLPPSTTGSYTPFNASDPNLLDPSRLFPTHPPSDDEVHFISSRPRQHAQTPTSASHMSSSHAAGLPASTWNRSISDQMPGEFPSDSRYGIARAGESVYTASGSTNPVRSAWQVPPQPPLFNGTQHGSFTPRFDNDHVTIYGSDSDDSASSSNGFQRNLNNTFEELFDRLNNQENRFDLGRSYGGQFSADDIAHLQADPTKSKEELENLLKNIRPDEDLPKELRKGTPAAMRVPLMEHQKLGLTWLENQESGTNKGSILADDMGLGKTVQALALMLSRPPTDARRNATLIIAPVALMRQWQREIADKCKRDKQLKTYVFHGSKKNRTWAQLNAFDVVLTTYGTIASELKRKEEFELRKRGDPTTTERPRDRLSLIGPGCRWHRVILDEAQCIKNKGTRTSKAVCHLDSTYRLCMTGTPMMNNVGELYSLIRFLRIPPYSVFDKFSTDILRPLNGRDYDQRFDNRGRENAMRKLQAVLKSILLRRTKTSKIDGNPILRLPDRTVEETDAVFDEDQASFYHSLEQQTALRVNKYLKANTVGKNYSNILVLLLRLRQACCHPHLIQDHGVPEGADISAAAMEALAHRYNEATVARIKAQEGSFECPICYDGTPNPMLFFPCGHDVCADCFTRMTDPSIALANGQEVNEAKCPECRSRVDPKEVISYSMFVKAHEPEKWRVEFRGDEDEADEDSDGSSTASDDESDDDEVNARGDLNDFVVADDETEEEDEDEDADDATKDDEYEPESKTKPRKNKKVKGKGKATRKSKANGKGKEKKKLPKSMAELRRLSQRNASAKSKYLKRLRKNWVTSAKIERTMQLLREIEEGDPTEKTIIFSQFTTFLDFMEVPIRDHGYEYRRYDGSMRPNERQQAVEEFMDDGKVKIMLVSLKAGNAGLNLNKASRVIMLDPFWNPFIEEQAIDRAHRIGQQRAVQVHRMLVKGTVEDRIVQLQEKKRKVINTALDENAGRSLSRLGHQELAYLFGISREL